MQSMIDEQYQAAASQRREMERPLSVDPAERLAALGVDYPELLAKAKEIVEEYPDETPRQMTAIGREWVIARGGNRQDRTDMAAEIDRELAASAKRQQDAWEADAETRQELDADRAQYEDLDEYDDAFDSEVEAARRIRR